MAPDLLFDPVFNEAKALAGVSDRKVGHPTAKHRINQLNDPIQRLRLVAAENILKKAAKIRQNPRWRSTCCWSLSCRCRLRGRPNDLMWLHALFACISFASPAG